MSTQGGGDKMVTLRGVARNAKAGAVVLTDDEGPIYIEGHDSWDDKTDGHSIEVTGHLVQKKYIPDPIRPSDGALCQGAEGEQLVMEGAKWRMIG